VDSADLSGLISIRGNLTGGSATARGTLDVGGLVRLTGTLHADGTTTIGKGVTASDLDVSGAFSLSGPLQCSGRVRWKGTPDSTDGVTASRVEFDGRGTIAGAVVATEFEGRLRDDSKMGSIRADRVIVRRPARLFGSGHLEVLTIEAKEVDLEGVLAQHIRAERIVLGAGCQIASVEGTISRQHPTAHVGPVSQTPRPYGLFR
jgi:hypothetical protein